MTPDPRILPTFACLALAVLLLWVPAPAIRNQRGWAWCPGLALACAVALADGLLDWRAPLWILLYVGLACGARTASRARVRVPLLVLTGAAAFLFALHAFPGFSNPVVVSSIRFSAGAPPYILRLNVDTAVAGIVLMGVFCERIAAPADWRAMLWRVWPVALSTPVVVLGLGCLLGFVRPDLKWTPYSAWFLASNLLVTCVTEEAFFRGFVLERMARWRGGPMLATVLSSLLFGLAHARGGMLLVLLATIAGALYAAAYRRSGRIEGAILTHFALNALHFLAFSYPSLAQ
jgi:membrane protease YdiL (CAAX protease family)